MFKKGAAVRNHFYSSVNLWAHVRGRRLANLCYRQRRYGFGQPGRQLLKQHPRPQRHIPASWDVRYVSCRDIASVSQRNHGYYGYYRPNSAYCWCGNYRRGSADTSTINQTTSSDNRNVNQNNNVNVSDSKSYSESVNRQVIDQNIKSPPPSAIAPSMMSYSQDLCTTGQSGAVQTQIIGLSAGRTVRDQNCERMKLSKTLYDMGMRVAAVSLLCQDPRVFGAMEMAGTPCPFMGLIGEEARAAWTENVELRPVED